MSRVALDDVGDGGGETLVLIHGLATTRGIWRRAVPRLSSGRRVLAVDVPGFGASPPSGPGFDIGTVADRIAAAVDEAGAGRGYDLVGHSMGGALALVLAHRHPAAVGRLVLAAPAGLRPRPPAISRVSGHATARFVAARRRAVGLADIAWGRRLLMSPGTADPAALPPAEVRAMVLASKGAVRIAEALAAVASADLRATLRDLPVPVGAIWGDRDRIIAPAGVATVRALRPEAPVETVVGAGHIPMMEDPAAFVHALETVLEKMSPAGNIAVASRS